MASSINASTASGGGVITTADASGVLNIQAAGTTIAAVSSTGVAVTGTLTSSSTVADATAIIRPLVSGTAVASTSGTSIDFTGIPSWAKRITVMFQGVSTNGTSVVQIQLGAGSVTTSGYLGASSAYGGGSTGSVANFTTGFGVGNFNSASNVRHGALILNNLSGNIWSCNGTITLSDSAGAGSSAGTISLGGTLDRVRITTINGTDTFDAGSINIMYE